MDFMREYFNQDIGKPKGRVIFFRRPCIACIRFHWALAGGGHVRKHYVILAPILWTTPYL